MSPRTTIKHNPPSTLAANDFPKILKSFKTHPPNYLGSDNLNQLLHLKNPHFQSATPKRRNWRNEVSQTSYFHYPGVNRH